MNHPLPRKSWTEITGVTTVISTNESDHRFHVFFLFCFYFVLFFFWGGGVLVQSIITQ